MQYERLRNFSSSTLLAFAAGYLLSKCDSRLFDKLWGKVVAKFWKSNAQHKDGYRIKLKSKPRSCDRKETTGAQTRHANSGDKVTETGAPSEPLIACQKQYQNSKDSKANANASNDNFVYSYEYDEELSEKCSFEIINADAIEWLKGHENFSGSVFTSMPDFSEMQLSVEVWRPWFVNAAKLILDKIPNGQYAIFYQTDVKRIGQLHQTDAQTGKPKEGGHHAAVMNEWIDKAHLIQTAADSVDGVRLLWHRIFLITSVGARKIGRPTYSHMLCFGKGGATIPDASRPSLPDVLDRGEMLSAKATGITACVFGALTLKLCGVEKVTDPFCGRASTLLACRLFQMDTTGVDLSKTACNTARSLGTKGFKAYADVALSSTFLKQSKPRRRRSEEI